MENKIKELENKVKKLEEQLMLASAFTDPKWTKENIQAEFVRINNNPQIIHAILAIIDKTIADIVMTTSNQNVSTEDRIHGLGGVFWLSTLASDIQNCVENAKKSILENLIRQ